MRNELRVELRMGRCFLGGDLRVRGEREKSNGGDDREDHQD